MLSNKQKKELRKAYFSGTIEKLIDKYAIEKITKKTLEEVDEFLAGLKEERAKLQKRISTYNLKEKEVMVLPGVSDLMNLTEGKKQALEQWEKQREIDYQKAQNIFAEAKNQAMGANMDIYMQWGFELAQLQYQLDLYRVWKDQLFRAKIINFMDSYGCSRAEAEERAKITPEYRDYKKAVLFRDLVEEVIMLCKKKYGAFN